MAYTACPPPKTARPSALADYDFDALDDLLYDWFLWEGGFNLVRGFSSEDKSFSKATSSRQYESTTDILEQQVTDYQMPLVAACIDELDGDARLAIRIEQRNRMGPVVWHNPRAPTKDAQARAYQAARTALSPILIRKGVEF